MTEATLIRKELREDVNELRQENEKLRKAVDECRTKYFDLLAESAKQRTRIEELTRQLQAISGEHIQQRFDGKDGC